MKIPTKLKIGGHEVKVDTSKELPGRNGEADITENTIRICKSIPQSQKESTLIHEIFHFMNTTFDATHDGHRILDSLSEQFYQVLKDNKLLK